MKPPARRICLITPGHVASTPRLVKNADALAAAGYEVHVVAGVEARDGVRPPIHRGIALTNVSAARLGPLGPLGRGLGGLVSWFAQLGKPVLEQWTQPTLEREKRDPEQDHRLRVGRRPLRPA